MQYRVHYRYRQWIGKSDPTDMGTSYIYSNDPSWIHERALRLKREGHKVLATQRWRSGKWVTL
jgi:hypothetical protein